MTTGVPTPSQRTSRLARGATGALALALLLLACAIWLDRPLSLWLNVNVPPALDKAFDRIGNLGDAGLYVAVGLICYIWALNGLARGWSCPFKSGFDRMARGSLLLLATMTVGGIITWLLKRLVSRARPEALLDHGIYGLGQVFAGKPYDSFPSSHTLAAFAVASVIAILSPRWRWPVMTLAVLVAASRVINRDHFLSDVCVGALIAICCAVLLAPRILDTRYHWPLRAPWRWWKAS
ncbi:phosphatase PAP2 family protein [Bordetella avium]|uniref:LpxE n=1 Tax=Bordetella avium TaxID=521 RepID=U3Q0C8_BORAV|nr:phosphatase PAP2 family protein [Bordetella avium]AGW82175.1 LpxE [Bordetella avium]AZY51742.1 phosphatase PAP2 family protein [Bordetella avium]RIQ13396.1 phosphatase PAP2 family protein [Bordetella avium]RIQ34992.1 phosphatase PAP2 family protein [Bordetella avium]RIQ38281.1 phosphatase PAP2 family protein [Bordetella avium]